MKIPAANPKSPAFATSIASSRSPNRWTTSTGPKISSRTTFASVDTPSITVGAMKGPSFRAGSVARSPPVRMRAPSFLAESTYEATVANCRSSTSGPRSASSSAPRRFFSAFATTRSTTSDEILSSTTSLLGTLHCCPEL